MNEKLLAQMNSFAKNVESRKQSEKLMVLLLVMAGLVLMYLSISYDPLSAEIARVQSQTSNLQRQIAEQQSTYATKVAASQEDPSLFANERLEAISRELQALDLEITNLAGDLVTPAEMTQILTSVLGRFAGLELVRFQNKPATPLRDGLDSNAAGSESAAIAPADVEGQVFEHGLVLEFEGDFFTTLKYLRFLEDVTGSFFWDSVSFRQLEWPNAHVTLEIHTLSTEAGFIGV